MDPYPFTDATGRSWHVFDYRVVNAGAEAKKRAVPIGHWSAEARAFVPATAEGVILVYPFGAVAYRDDLRPRFLEDQLRLAKPLAGERLAGA